MSLISLGFSQIISSSPSRSAENNLVEAISPRKSGAVSDMRPEELQAAQLLLGKEAVCCDTAYGQSNILKAREKNIHILKIFSDCAQSICKRARRTIAIRNDLITVG